MEQKGPGADLDRGEERGYSREPRPDKQKITFRPALGLYIAPPFLILFGGAPLVGAFAAGPLDLKGMISGGLLIAAGLYLVTSAWARYRIDDEGIEVRAKGRRRYWRWDEIGGVRGAEMGGRGVGKTISQIVVDHEDQILFRLSPWTAKRRLLATQIRQRSADARDRPQPLP